MTDQVKNVEYYLRLPYTVILRRDDEGDYIARIDELPGCVAHGESQREALENLEEAQHLWITDCLESGQPVPQPVDDGELPSGKWVQRVPRTLHKKLVDLAKREKVSLNQLVTAILGEAVGTRNPALLARHEPLHVEWATEAFSHAWNRDVEATEELKQLVGSWKILEPKRREKTLVVGSLQVHGRQIPNRFTLETKKKEDDFRQIRQHWHKR